MSSQHNSIERLAREHAKTKHRYRELLIFLMNETIPYLEDLDKLIDSENIVSDVRVLLHKNIDEINKELKDFIVENIT